MTVRRNLAYSLRLRGMPAAEIDARVGWAADLLSLAPYLDRRPGTLSGGQKQRVALGRAIVREPQVFLMDEPLSNLDAKLRAQMRAEITRLHDRLHTTTLYVTHDQAEAMTLADRIVVLKNGEVQQVAAPGAMYGAPANMFVAGFIGSPTMNFFRALLARDDRRYTLRWRGLDLAIDPRPAARWASAASHVGREVVAGVRPENFSVSPGIGFTPAGAIRGRVQVIENLGSERFLFVEPSTAVEGSGQIGSAIVEDDQTNDRTMAARDGPSSRIERGDAVWLFPDPASIHLFDPATGQSLC
jgi:multiple sugar transport system ATP-binding protein